MKKRHLSKLTSSMLFSFVIFFSETIGLPTFRHLHENFQAAVVLFAIFFYQKNVISLSFEKGRKSEIGLKTAKPQYNRFIQFYHFSGLKKRQIIELVGVEVSILNG